MIVYRSHEDAKAGPRPQLRWSTVRKQSRSHSCVIVLPRGAACGDELASANVPLTVLFDCLFVCQERAHSLLFLKMVGAPQASPGAAQEQPRIR